MSGYQKVVNLFHAGKLTKLKAILLKLEKKHALNQSASPVNIILVRAARDGFYEMILYLLDEFESNVSINKGVRLYVQPSQHMTKYCQKPRLIDSVPPLVAACTNDNVEMVQYLVSKGADLNKQAPYWGGALHVAAQYGCISVMKYLLDSGMNVNTTNYRGCTPLMMICGLSFCEEKCVNVINAEQKTVIDGVVEFLLLRGANAYHKSIEGYTVVHEAARYGRLDIIKVLLAHLISPLFSIEDLTRENFVPCPLYLAAAYGFSGSVKYLCDLKSCPDICKGNAYILLASSSMHDVRDVAYTYEEPFWKTGLAIFETATDKPTYLPPLKEYEYVQEIKTNRELNTASQSSDFLVIGRQYQYLLVRERCLGLHQLSLVSSILKSAANIRVKIKDRNIDGLCHRALEVCLLNIDKKIINEDFVVSVLNSILHLTFSFYNNPSDSISCLAKIALLVFEKVGETSETNQNMLTLLLCFQTWLNILIKKDSFLSLSTLPTEFHALGCRMVSLTISLVTSGHTVFHVLPYNNTKMQPRTYFLELLLLWGAHQVIDSPCVNQRGRRPLHCLAQQTSCSPHDISLLLSYGAHIDAVDARGKTPLDYCSSESPIQAFLYSRPLPLSCYCARTIVSEGIPYKFIDIPKHIVKLIELHDPKSIVTEIIPYSPPICFLPPTSQLIIS